MQNKLPEEYVIQKFYEYSGAPVFKKFKNMYNASCPSCREGSSWLKKKRLFYIPDKNFLHCHNCNKSWSPVNWIMEQTGMTYYEVLKDSKATKIDILKQVDKQEERNIRNEHVVEDIPSDSINLFDEQQVEYYSTDLTVKRALYYIKDRRLDTAINRPPAMFLSLNDFVHKNRLIIPFYNNKNEIIWYQSRGLLEQDLKERPKYLSKYGDRHVFGLNNVSPDCNYIFIFEGPIDSMFCSKNGIAVCGISLSQLQENELESYNLYKKIWVLDNQLDNPDVKEKMLSLAQMGERVFIWPSGYEKFKDVNDVCTEYKIDKIGTKFFIENSFIGPSAVMKLK